MKKQIYIIIIGIIALALSGVLVIQIVKGIETDKYDIDSDYIFRTI